MKAADFGRSLPRGIGINLLVPEIVPMEIFCRTVLGANTIHADEDFAAIELQGSVFMLHADHSYLDHEMTGVVAGNDVRGIGVEIRIYGADPDRIEARHVSRTMSSWRPRWTSRTACANAMSSGRGAMSSSRAKRSTAEPLRCLIATIFRRKLYFNHTRLKSPKHRHFYGAGTGGRRALRTTEVGYHGFFEDWPFGSDTSVTRCGRMPERAHVVAR